MVLWCRHLDRNQQSNNILPPTRNKWGFWHNIYEWNSQMDFDVRAFVQVVERGGFTAAELISVSRRRQFPSSSHDFEDRLGVRLLHRTTRRLALTPEGETFYLRARDIVAAIEDAEAEVSQAGQLPRGRLRVNCVAGFAFHELSRVIPDFLARYPDIDVELSISDRLVDLLARTPILESARDR